ncbi:MAG: serine/threonine protein kinase, partial [Polyangiaceae bacterium]|nr:serine/threonine protein kinase [Polyangiaceae bacterium]
MELGTSVSASCPSCGTLVFSEDSRPTLIPQAYAPGAIVQTDLARAPDPETPVDPRAQTVALGTGPVLPSDLHFPPVTRIAHYDILGEIARGGMGVVYRARDTKLNRLVAVKVLLEGQHASQESVERFLREAQNTARLRHQSIVPIFDLGVHDGKNYLVMEYIVGQPLSHLIHSKDLTVERSVDLILQAAEAVEHAHREGIVHRDLKPANILVDTEWRSRVTDFGLAKGKKSSSDLTKSGTAMGTPYYMPPEQARGDMRLVDARSDVYSLGAVLYECLAGQPPLVGENDIDTIIKVVNEEPLPPSTLRPGVPGDLDQVCLKALEKDPARRYQSARELLEELRRYRSGEGVLARGNGAMSRLMRRARRHRSLLVSGAMGFAAAVTLFAIVRLGGAPERPERPHDPGPPPILAQAEIPYWQARDVAWSGTGWAQVREKDEDAWTASEEGQPLIAGATHEGIARLSFTLLADAASKPDLEVRLLSNPLHGDEGYTVRMSLAWNTLEVSVGRGTDHGDPQSARATVTQRWIPVRIERTVDGLWVWTGGTQPAIRYFDPGPGFRRESRQIALVARKPGARVGALRLETASDAYLRHAVGTGDRMFDRQAWDIAAEQYRFALTEEPKTDIEWEAVYKLALCDLKEGEGGGEAAAFDRAAEGLARVLRQARGRPA